MQSDTVCINACQDYISATSDHRKHKKVQQIRSQGFIQFILGYYILSLHHKEPQCKQLWLKTELHVRNISLSTTLHLHVQQKV